MEWIKVGRKRSTLPPHSYVQEVIFLTGRLVHVGDFVMIRNNRIWRSKIKSPWYDDKYGYIPSKYVTHWMPIELPPKPPKEQASDKN